MAASFPGAIKNFSAVVNGVTKLVASLFNLPYDEITAIQTELGTDPAGSMSDVKTRLAVSMNDNGTIKNIMGAYAAANPDTAYQAATDGFVVAYNTYGYTLTGYCSQTADPTDHQVLVNGNQSEGFSFPVPKGWYWQVNDGGGAGVIHWVPLGT